MTNRVQTLRSSTAGNRPSGRAPGELYSNWPDKQLGVIDPSQAPMDLIGVRFFSATANYAIGDHVINAGYLYRAKVTVAAGAFDPSQWSVAGGAVKVADTAPAGPQAGDLWWDSVGGQLYIFYQDANSSQWVVANNVMGGYLPLSGGNLTGALNLAADPATPLGAVTKEYADAGDSAARSYADASINANAYGGFINKLRNGTFDVWQRGTNFNIAAGAGSTFGPDGWQIYSPTAWTAQRSGGAAAPPTRRTAYCLNLIGATTSTGVFSITQNIEGSIAAQLSGSIVTLQAMILNNTGSAFTPMINAGYFTALDNSSGVTLELNNISLQSCPGGNVWTRIAYSWMMSNNAVNGYQVGLVFPAGVLAVAGINIGITACDLRATPGLPVGLCAAPPPPELRPIATETLFCQRYYQATLGVAEEIVGGTVMPGATYYSWVAFRPTMRATPTITTGFAAASNFPSVAPSVLVPSARGFRPSATSNAAATAPGFVNFTWTASAEL